MKYNIDKSKIIPGLVIHTPTLEQMKAVCECTTDSSIPDKSHFEISKTETCIEVYELDYWRNSYRDAYKRIGSTITPFEDILIKDWKHHLTTTKSAVRVSNLEEITHLANFLGFTNGNWDNWLLEYPDSLAIGVHHGKAYYFRENSHKSNGYTVYKYSDIFPDKEQPMQLYKVGERFYNTDCKMCTITEYHPSNNTYTIFSQFLNEESNVTAYQIAKFWVKITEKPQNTDYTNDSLHSYNPHTDKPIVALDANPTKSKEKQMNNTTLKLLFTFMGVSTETPKDATNSNYIGIITNSEDAYVGYVYADTVKQLKEIIAKSENEGNTIHCFKFQDSYKQATRPVVKITRSTPTADENTVE